MDLTGTILLVLAASSLLAVLFTVVPLLPGALFPIAGMAALGAIEGWERVPVWAWVAQAAALFASLAVDNVAQLLGVRRVGGTRRAMVGGAIGVVAGPFLLAPVMGPLALLFGPPLGAVAGTLLGERSARHRLAPNAGTGPEEAVPAGTTDARAGYRRLGIGALVAYVVGTVVKLGVVTVQLVVLFVVAT